MAFKGIGPIVALIQIIYVSNGDVEESIVQIRKFQDRTQFDLSAQELIREQLKNPILKKVLYSTKFLYYLYLGFTILVKDHISNVSKKAVEDNSSEINQFLNLSKNGFDLSNIILVFDPNVDSSIVNLVRNSGVETYHLLKEAKDHWTFENDIHWICYVHEVVANQVAVIVKDLLIELEGIESD